MSRDIWNDLFLFYRKAKKWNPRAGRQPEAGLRQMDKMARKRIPGLRYFGEDDKIGPKKEKARRPSVLHGLRAEKDRPPEKTSSQRSAVSFFDRRESVA